MVKRMQNIKEDPILKFQKECKEEIAKQGNDKEFLALSKKWSVEAIKHKYSYHFSWFGRPIIQLPTDIVAMQQIIWESRPDVIIETGIAHGGGLIFYASILEMMNMCGINKESQVIGVDIDIREHNRKAIEEHPIYKLGKIKMIEGSSVSAETLSKIKSLIKPNSKVLVTLDSCHTHDHVLKELELYSQFVTKGSYLVVMDTIVETIDCSPQGERPWHKGANPYTALKEWLSNKENSRRFEIRDDIDNQFIFSSNPNGYLYFKE